MTEPISLYGCVYSSAGLTIPVCTTFSQSVMVSPLLFSFSLLCNKTCDTLCQMAVSLNTKSFIVFGMQFPFHVEGCIGGIGGSQLNHIKEKSRKMAMYHIKHFIESI